MRVLRTFRRVGMWRNKLKLRFRFFPPLRSQAVIKFASKLPHTKIRTNYYSYIYRTHANINFTIYGQQTHRFAQLPFIHFRCTFCHVFICSGCFFLRKLRTSSLFYDLISRGFRLAGARPRDCLFWPNKTEKKKGAVCS